MWLLCKEKEVDGKMGQLSIDVRLTRFSWPRKRKINCRRNNTQWIQNSCEEYSLFLIDRVSHRLNWMVGNERKKKKKNPQKKPRAPKSSLSGFIDKYLVLKSGYCFFFRCASATNVANKTLFTFCDHVNSTMKNSKQ